MNDSPTYLDTNILVRYYTGSNNPNSENQRKAVEAKLLLDRVEQRREKIVTNFAAIFETVFVLERSYKVRRSIVAQMLMDFISLPNVGLANKRLLARAFGIYVRYSISITDAYIAADMEARNVHQVYSWDTDFDKIPGIVRILSAEA